jgi:hypothetical protein
MIVASCPACHEQVTVPIDASPSSLVRCPLCHAEFQLGAFLSQLPPPLIVVQHQEPPARSEVAPPEVPSDSGVLHLDAPEVNDLAAASGVDGPLPPFDFTPGSAPTPQPGRAREPARRPPRPQKNMAWEITKIVGGGLLAIPAAQAILWWFVPRDWQRDLLGIGPAVSRVVPWVVPLQFRDLPVDADANDLSSSEPWLDRRGVAPRTDLNAKPRLAAKPKEAASLDEQVERVASESNAREGQGGQPEPAAAPGEMASSPKSDGGAATSAAASQQSDTNVSQAGPASGTVYQVEDLRVALERAKQASDDWEASSDQSEEHRAELTKAFYQAFARLGEVLFSLSREDPQGEELLKDLSMLLESFAQQPKKLAMIGNRGQVWLEQETRPNSGVMLFGTVRGISPSGSLFATDLDLAAMQKRLVTVISPGDPERFYGVGDRVLILGVLIPPPADAVAAAPQHAVPETYVWGSLPVSLGK